ncbi:MAG: transcriptional regulator [Candidatus Levybacteria bacterium RBG_16_35_11]|nr:MAG: transcriptional regulator [Candidatus Levybacteria bacterium RBG_16_35_11]
MPEISRFFGIIITMFFDDHNPPHFHARYGSYKAAIRIEDFALLEGYLPPRALGLVMEWAEIHKDALLKDWGLASQKKPLFKIEPLT